MTLSITICHGLSPALLYEVARRGALECLCEPAATQKRGDGLSAVCLANCTEHAQGSGRVVGWRTGLAPRVTRFLDCPPVATHRGRDQKGRPVENDHAQGHENSEDRTNKKCEEEPISDDAALVERDYRSAEDDGLTSPTPPREPSSALPDPNAGALSRNPRLKGV